MFRENKKMKTGLFSKARRWVAALGMAAAVTAPTLSTQAVAAPLVPLAQASVPAAPDADVVQIRDGRRYYRHRDWDRGRYYRHRHHRNNGLALGLGIGLPLAYLATRPSYNYAPYGYYDDGYYVRRVPRHVNRGYGNRHVSWCYNRYRSYRAYDNTFQPNHGRRQQCYSPFS